MEGVICSGMKAAEGPHGVVACVPADSARLQPAGSGEQGGDVVRFVLEKACSGHGVERDWEDVWLQLGPGTGSGAGEQGRFGGWLVWS